MQLIPSTAKLTARRMGLSSPSVTQLHQPGLNIKLGSFHLGWLINRFEGQTALAVAAYNAGEKRVDRWTKDKKELSLDVWVEQIPFKETRNYVKNVLAFRQVYSQLLGQPEPFLSKENKHLR
jgi:soluble lytic murein transglycosylase